MILLLNSNGNIDGKPIARMLQNLDLDMRDAIKSRIHLKGPHILIRGPRQIDGAWITPDIELHAACFLLFFFGVRQHRGIILDILQQSLLGGATHTSTPPIARHLQYIYNSHSSKHEIYNLTFFTRKNCRISKLFSVMNKHWPRPYGPHKDIFLHQPWQY